MSNSPIYKPVRNWLPMRVGHPTHPGWFLADSHLTANLPSAPVRQTNRGSDRQFYYRNTDAIELASLGWSDGFELNNGPLGGVPLDTGILAAGWDVEEPLKFLDGSPDWVTATAKYEPMPGRASMVVDPLMYERRLSRISIGQDQWPDDLPLDREEMLVDMAYEWLKKRYSGKVESLHHIMSCWLLRDVEPSDVVVDSLKVFVGRSGKNLGKVVATKVADSCRSVNNWWRIGCAEEVRIPAFCQLKNGAIDPSWERFCLDTGQDITFIPRAYCLLRTQLVNGEPKMRVVQGSDYPHSIGMKPTVLAMKDVVRLGHVFHTGDPMDTCIWQVSRDLTPESIRTVVFSDDGLVIYKDGNGKLFYSGYDLMSAENYSAFSSQIMLQAFERLFMDLEDKALPDQKVKIRRFCAALRHWRKTAWGLLLVSPTGIMTTGEVLGTGVSGTVLAHELTQMLHSVLIENDPEVSAALRAYMRGELSAREYQRVIMLKAWIGVELDGKIVNRNAEYTTFLSRFVGPGSIQDGSVIRPLKLQLHKQFCLAESPERSGHRIRALEKYGDRAYVLAYAGMIVARGQEIARCYERPFPEVMSWIDSVLHERGTDATRKLVAEPDSVKRLIFHLCMGYWLAQKGTWDANNILMRIGGEAPTGQYLKPTDYRTHYVIGGPETAQSQWVHAFSESSYHQKFRVSAQGPIHEDELRATLLKKFPVLEFTREDLATALRYWPLGGDAALNLIVSQKRLGFVSLDPFLKTVVHLDLNVYGGGGKLRDALIDGFLNHQDVVSLLPTRSPIGELFNPKTLWQAACAAALGYERGFKLTSKHTKVY